ncbi:hypothetical protein FQA39_LY17971 [Lamprigera yunnana]|nr:hypothetical protein FQA39_LY17971 [Lamprigera yunnana]
MNIFGKRFLLNYCKIQNNIATFKSNISLETLYPTAELKLKTPEKVFNNGQNYSGYIPLNELQITYTKSSGPGGQNVNKVNTKVDLRFHLESATWLAPDIKICLCLKLKNKITNDGFLVFRSDLTRSQQLNLADCLNKLRTLIYQVAKPEPVTGPETSEMLRRRYEKAVQERLLEKRYKSLTKEARRNICV